MGFCKDEDSPFDQLMQPIKQIVAPGQVLLIYL
jgi:hypothetical protein